ncbi:hypothetical protein PO878_18155 [Iamia majanohamensis]|uniref:Lipoprotein n=1 Tax=Iamia majanohamensis TaxID=467976 RepID=A0AAE9Y4C4_9ACTN|nr:hypothetical protein [Iamia majanohamensis]WCO66425.1 hypothetical protein PO878_18155 [Iamia majanohamensis]
MRTSPSHVRRPSARRVAAALVVAGLVLAGAACGDGGDETSTPTTTAPAGAEGSTTTAAGGGATTTAPADDDAPATTEADEATPTTVAGDDADVLTVDEAGAQLQALLNGYRSALISIRGAGTIDERSLQVLSAAFTSAAAEGEISGLRQIGGAAALNPSPPALGAEAVDLTEATATCASGTVQVSGLDQVTVTPVQLGEPHYFRIVPAPEGAPSPGWRIDFLRFSTDGTPLDEAACS